MCNGSTACGKSTVPSGNIGSGLAIAPTYRLRRSVRARSEPRRRSARLLTALAREETGQHVELACRLRELPEPAEEPGEITALAQRDPGDAQPQARHPHHRARVALQQRVLQVAEHPFDDRASTDRHQELRPEPRAGVRGREQLGAAGQVEPRASVEGVEPLPRRGADEEVTRHADAVQLQAGAPSDLEHQHAQRDRDAEVPIEHVVEVRVARVAVVGRVAGEALGDEQMSRELAGRQPRGRCGERVEVAEAGVEIELRVRVRGDEECRFVERDLGLRAREQLREAIGEVQGSTVAPDDRLETMSGSTADPSVEQMHDTVAARLNAVGQRLTANRQSLLDTLTAAPRPLTIPEILDDRPGLAQSSVYRNLVVLEDAGVVHRVVGADEFARWELAEDLAGH